MNAALRAHLVSLNTAAAARVFPVLLPQNVSYPALTYQLVSDPRELTHSGADGLVEARYQITAWASSHKEMSELREEVRANLHGLVGQIGDVTISNARYDGSTDLYDAGVGEKGKAGVHHGPADYIIQYSE